MTYTLLKSKPGEYVWDEQRIQFVGRINKDGTEDKRFSKGGLCSLLNNIIESTGYVPSNPQSFAKRISEHKQSSYLVQGFGVLVKCYDLSAEMWVAKAAEKLGIEGDGITDILEHVSRSKETEHKAKIETLALLFGKELKSKKLGDLTEVTEFEKRLKMERKERAVKHKEEVAQQLYDERYNRLLSQIIDFVETAPFEKCLEVMELSDKYSNMWAVGCKICKLKLTTHTKTEFYKAYKNQWSDILREFKYCCLSELIANAIFDASSYEEKTILLDYAINDYWNSVSKLKDKLNAS